MKKILIIFGVVVILAVSAYAVWRFGLLDTFGVSSPSSENAPGIGIPSNPLENVPEINPVGKTNPFKDVKTNPFD